MPFWATAFLCMAALAGQQWARPVRHDVYEHGNDSLFHAAVEKDSVIAVLWHIPFSPFDFLLA